MKKLVSLVGITSILLGSSVLHGHWVQRQSLMGIRRSFSNCFDIGTKVYLAGYPLPLKRWLSSSYF